MNKKSWLYKVAIAVNGREMTKDEIASFDPESLIGKQVDVMVEQQPAKDSSAIYNNILSFTKTAKPLPAFEVAKEAKVEKTSQPLTADEQEVADVFGA